MSRGFTFIEALAILVVVFVGMTAVVSLVMLGLRESGEAQREAVAMSTAISVAHDPRPLLAPARSGDWSYTPINLDDILAVNGQATGWINGLYVVRNEHSGPEDVIANDGTRVFARAVDVSVDVYDGRRDIAIASFSTRLVRQCGTP